MKKHEFLDALKNRLAGLPKSELEERLSFYSEMIDDRIEEGLTEEEAVSKIGSVDEVAKDILSDIPFFKIAKEKIKLKRSLKSWEIVLLAVGLPIWLSLLVSIIAVIISLYAVIWSVIISLYAVLISLIAGAIGGVLFFIGLLVSGKSLSAFAVLGASIFVVGLALLTFIACKKATRYILLLTKKITIFIKQCFLIKEEQ